MERSIPAGACGRSHVRPFLRHATRLRMVRVVAAHGHLRRSVMERIQRAIEIARQQRGSLSVVQNVSAEPDFGFVQPPLPPEALPELTVPRLYPLNEPALRSRRVVFADDA